MMEVLAEFVHECSPDPVERCVATAALVLSLWQLRGRKLTPHVPSLLLVRPEGQDPDPLDEWVRDFVYDEEENKPSVQTSGPFVHGPVELAPKAMSNALHKRQAMGMKPPGDAVSKSQEARNYEEKFHAARVTGFGRARCRGYTEAWHPDYGLLTEQDNQVLLRLNNEGDREAFCKDLLESPGKLLYPVGIGSDLFPVPKSLCISGALTTRHWQATFAERLLCSGLPVFPLAHPSNAGFESTHRKVPAYIAAVWMSASLPAVSASLRMPPLDLARDYHAALRKRLAVLPRQAEFPILQTIHQLEGVCSLIIDFVSDSGTPPEEATALCHDLYGNTLRALIVGITSLSCFGFGLRLGPDCEPLREKALKLIRELRHDGPVKKSLWSKNNHIAAGQRDLLLRQLAEENLLRVENDTLVATTFPDFLRGLYEREEFPVITNHWKAARAQRGAEASASA